MCSVGLGFYLSQSSQMLQSGGSRTSIISEVQLNRISVQLAQIEALGYFYSGRLLKLWLLQSKRNLLHYHKFSNISTFICPSVESFFFLAGGQLHCSTPHVLHEGALTELKTKDATIDICSSEYNQIKNPTLHDQHTLDLPEPFFFSLIVSGWLWGIKNSLSQNLSKKHGSLVSMPLHTCFTVISFG